LAKNEEGEFELILGNRQLISVFLIVVILLGIFFSMGYIVGRNSAPSAVETAREARPSSLHWPSADAEKEKAAPAPAQQLPLAPPEPDVPAKAKPQAEHPAEHPAPPPAAAPKATAAAKPTPIPKPAAPPKKEEKPKVAAPPPAPATPAARASVTGDPATGDYWQVVATSRPDAEIITETLSKKGFHAVMAPAPKDGIFRVLVGPLRDTSSQAQTRTALEGAGFKNPLLRKY
jgi:outer membrane biosynthesis protein TonB